MASDPAGPPPHPRPSATLQQQELPLIELHITWYRQHQCDSDPLEFDRSAEDRFNAPDGQYGVLYLGSDPPGVFIETFDEPHIRTITTQELGERCLCIATTTRPLRLVDLTGAGLRHIGADSRIATGNDYAVAQAWSLALWQHPVRVDGLYYVARNDPSRHSLALFDRAADTLHLTCTYPLTDPYHATTLDKILTTYRFMLDDKVN